MVIVPDPSDLPRITNPAIRELVALRFRQLHSPDALAATRRRIHRGGGRAMQLPKLSRQSVCPSCTGLFDDLPYTDPDFQPCSEILEEHTNEHSCIYEMVFISNDDGAATAIFIPDTEGIDADLLAMCRSFATPAVTSP